MSTPPVKLVGALLWILVASGPLLGGMALLRSGQPSPPAAPPTPSAAVTGLAELAVRAHLTGLPADLPVALAPGHAGLRPGADALEGLTPAERVAAARSAATAVDVAALDAEPAGPGRWGVTVGVVRDRQVEAWQVTVADGSDGPVVETLPALVGLPDRGTPPAPSIPRLAAPDPDHPVHVAVDGFVTALLTAEGDLARYTAAGSAIVPPAPVADAALRRIAAAPIGEGRAAALAEVVVQRGDGAAQVLHYPLLLQPSGGPWEVVRILPALPLPTAP